MSNLNDIIWFSDQVENLNQLIQNKSYSKVLLLLDTHVHDHALTVLASKVDLSNVEIIEIEPGEEHKTLETCSNIWAFMSEENIKRNALMINFGGGVVTDMGGFIAASYKRGIDFVQIPTTLLAMVDASVGAKVGVDFLHFKNQIGAFANPVAVYIDSEFLNTLSISQWLSGFAEMIKHAIIKGGAHYQKLLQVDKMEDVDEAFIQSSIEVKKELVTQDPREKGARKCLNLGHTIGHAIESFALKNEETLLHGHAVALGIIAELEIAEDYYDLPKHLFQDLINFIRRKYPPFYVKESDLSELLSFMKQDKKNTNEHISFSLVKDIGEVQWDQFPDQELILKVLRKEFVYENQ